MTPLHMAAKQGRPDTAKYLVDQRANINITDNNGVSDNHDGRFVLLL